MLKKLLLPIIEYRMKKKDKELLIESVILTAIYLLSFGILSLGRIQQTFFGISESAFSNMQMITLTFIFAVIITFAIYSLYKKAIK
jgi:hypothetical protein